MYDITTGAMAALPIPTIKRAIIIKNSDGAIAVRILPKVKIAIPINNVAFLPITSPSLPRMGANAAVEAAIAKAVHVVLLYGKFKSLTNAGPSTAVNPPTAPTKNAASAYGTKPLK